jgi:hypothetical protein
LENFLGLVNDIRISFLFVQELYTAVLVDVLRDFGVKDLDAAILSISYYWSPTVFNAFFDAITFAY